MQILARTINNKVLQLSISLASYLHGPISNAFEEDVDPFYILESYMPLNYTAYLDSELLAELERACLLAVRGKNELAYVHPVEIDLDLNDLREFKKLYYQIYAQPNTIA
jgi:hypothetical protein